MSSHGLGEYTLEEDGVYFRPFNEFEKYPLCFNYCVAGSQPEGFYALYNLVCVAVLMPIVGTLGILGNALSLYVFTRAHMRTTTNLCLAALAVSDFMIIITGLFLFTVDGVKRFAYFIEILYVRGTPLFFPLGLTAQSASVFFTVLAAVDCFVLTIAPRVHRTGCGTGLISVAIAFSVLFAVAYNVVHLFEMDIVECWSDEYLCKSLTICPTAFRMDPVYYLVYYNYLYMIVMSGGPLMLLIVINSIIIGVTFTRNRRRKSSAPLSPAPPHAQHPSAPSVDGDDPITLVLVVCLFIVCNSLALIINLCESAFGAQMRDFGNYLVDVSNLLVICNSSANFLIYYKYDARFRCIVQELVQEKTRRNNRGAQTQVQLMSVTRTAVNGSECTQQLLEHTQTQPKSTAPACVVTVNPLDDHL